MASRIVNLSVLPGEPLDGTGKVCVHLFLKDSNGTFVEPHALHPVYKDGLIVKGQLEAKPTRGRLACNPKRNAVPATRNGITTVTPRSDDPRAVTCPRCLASAECKKMLEV